MIAYILRRILLIIPTMFGIMVVNFVIVQFAPGGPVERMIAQLTGTDVVGHGAHFGGGGGDFAGGAGQGGSPATCRRRPNIAARKGSTRNSSRAREAVRLRQAAARALRHDAVELSPLRFRRELFPRHQRAQADREKLPVSISLGLWMTLLSYVISIPLGIRKAVQRRLALRHVDQRR